MGTYLYKDINDAIKHAKDMQKIYDKELAGKSVLYAYSDNNTIKFAEVVFKAENYLHLTGLDYNHIRENNLINGTKNPTQANNFYLLLKSNTPIPQMAKNISFITLPDPKKNNTIFENTQNKLNNLSRLVIIALTAQEIGLPKPKSARSNSKVEADFFISYKKLMLAIKDDGQNFFPLSSMNGNPKETMKNPQKILAIYQKNINEHLYKLYYLNSEAVSKIDKSIFEKDFLDRLSLNSFKNDKKVFNPNALSIIRHKFIISSVKSDLSELSQKRQHVYDSNNETGLNEYIKSRDKLIEHLKAYIETEPNEKIKESIFVIYGYARVSTPKQNVLRQVRNILEYDSNAQIFQEKYSGVTLARPEWKKLMKAIEPNDTIIFDEVSRMSRDAEEGFNEYERLFNMNVNLVFLRQPHVNSDVYRTALNNTIEMTGIEGAAPLSVYK